MNYLALCWEICRWFLCTNLLYFTRAFHYMFICQFAPTPCECVCELVPANVCGSSIFVFGKLNLHNEMENGIHILWRETKRKEQNRKETNRCWKWSLWTKFKPWITDIDLCCSQEHRYPDINITYAFKSIDFTITTSKTRSSKNYPKYQRTKLNIQNAIHMADTNITITY